MGGGGGLEGSHTSLATSFFRSSSLSPCPALPFSALRCCVQEMAKLQKLLESVNAETFNPAGLNILPPRRSAFLFVSVQPREISTVPTHWAFALAIAPRFLISAFARSAWQLTDALISISLHPIPFQFDS